MNESSRAAQKRVAVAYIKKFVLWLIITALICAACICYCLSHSGKYSLGITLGASAVVCVILFFCMKLHKYFFDRTYCGTITELSVRTAPGVAEGSSALPRGSKMRLTNDNKLTMIHYVSITVEKDGGAHARHDISIPIGKPNPYRVGDRVMHIRGAYYLCRFPRGDTETVYDPISVVCPACGDIQTLGSVECAFCGCELPRDAEV